MSQPDPATPVPALDPVLFAALEDLLQRVDADTARIAAAYPDDVACKAGCATCCKSFFDITLVEGFYLLRGLAGLPADVRAAYVAKAQAASADLARAKRSNDVYARDPALFVKDLTPAVVDALGGVFCPLLDAAGGCGNYAHRPVMCRAYGYHRPHWTHPEQLDHCYLNFRNLRARGEEPDRALALDVNAYMQGRRQAERDFVQAVFGSADVAYRSSIAAFVAHADRTLADWTSLLAPYLGRARAVAIRFFAQLASAEEVGRALADPRAEADSAAWAAQALRKKATARALDAVLNAFFDYMAGQRIDQPAVARTLRAEGWLFRRHCLLLALQQLDEALQE